MYMFVCEGESVRDSVPVYQLGYIEAQFVKETGQTESR